MKSSLTCTFDTTTRLLTVTNCVDSDNLGGATMTFKVSTFQNPYNGITKGGFQLTTYEATGLGMIDQTS